MGSLGLLGFAMKQIYILHAYLYQMLNFKLTHYPYSLYLHRTDLNIFKS